MCGSVLCLSMSVMLHLAHPRLALAHCFPPLHSLPQSSLPFIKRIKDKRENAAMVNIVETYSIESVRTQREIPH